MRTFLIPLTLGIALATAPAAAQNLLLGPNFDDNGDVADWDLDVGLSLNWSLEDESDCGNSGSAFAQSANVGGIHFVTVSQCVAIDGPGSFWGRARYRTQASFTITLETFNFSTCTDLLTAVSTNYPASPVNWATANVGSVIMPASGESVRLTLSAVSPSLFDLSLDRTFLGPDEPIFLDDFDGNDPGPANSNRPCRWSSRVF